MFKRAQKKEWGQALVEMAITAPILILILSGLLDLGRVYYTFIALEEAAAEAALYLAIEPSCQNSADPDTGVAGNPCDDPNNALYRGKTAGNEEFDPSLAEWNIPWDSSLLADGWTDPFDNCGGYQGIGCIVIVQVRYQFEFLTPGMQNISIGVSGDPGLTLQVQATQIVIFE
jgi:hypothetical protein